MERTFWIRYARMEDVKALGRIMVNSFRNAFAGFISKETLDRCAVEENCAGLFRGLLEEGKMRIVLGGLGQTPMGLICWSEKENGWTEIEAIHSLSESWGTGLGAALLEFALDGTNAKKGVGLWAFEENKRARRFYEKHGLRWTGERRVSEFDGAIEVRYERKWE